MNPKYPTGWITCIYERARQLRKETTPAERILWQRLRNRRFGNAKFRRQQPIDCYIADFFCAEARIVIELDGDSHMGREERDAHRQAYIESHDLRVVRFWNTEVYEELDWVLETLARVLRERTKTALSLPSPLAGEGRRVTTRRGEGGGSTEVEATPHPVSRVARNHPLPLRRGQ